MMNVQRTLNWKSFFQNAGIALAVSAILVSCKKEDHDNSADLNGHYHKIIRVENLPVNPTDLGTPANKSGVYFYSLKENRVIPADSVKSTKWDLGFGGLFTSFLSGNNGGDDTNYGKGSSGIGGVAVIEAKFEDVQELPANLVFKTSKDVIGTDDQGAYGVGMGWYLYDFTGKYVKDGAPESQHVAYALASPLVKKDGTVVKPRTVIVKTAQGDFAKIKMISCYKNLFEQSQWKFGAPMMYATFEYVLIPKGENRFTIK